MRAATNPYRVDGPLREGDFAVGRQDILAWTQESLRSGETLLLVYGLPKAGKTTLLQQLRQHLNSDYTCIIEEVPTTDPSEITSWLTQLQQDIAADPQRHETDRPTLLMLDGLSLYTADDRTWQALLPPLREMASPMLRVLLAVGGHVAQVAADPSSPLAQIPARQMGHLTESEVESLLVGTAGGRLRYDYDAIGAVYHKTAGHPYLVQLFGYELFDYAARYGRVNVHAVGKVLERVLNAAAGTFQMMWEALSARAKMALTAFGEHRGRHDLFTGQDVRNFLRWRGIQMPGKEAEEALAELVARGLILRLGHDSYQVELELLQDWLERQKPISQVVREVKRYRRTPPARASSRPQPRIRWLAVFQWLLIIAIAFLIVWMWRSRDLSPTATITPPAAAGASTPTVAPLTPAIPTAKRIVYARREDQQSPWKIYALWDDEVDIEAREVITLTEKAYQDAWPSWSPDGAKILFVSDRQGNRDVWVMDANGRHAVNLTRNPADDWTPAWSPDGKSVAFSSYRDENWDIYRMNADGSRQTRLTEDPAEDVAPSWSPDGTRIVFASRRDGNWELYIMNADGSAQTRLTNHEATDTAPAWSPRGDWIAFESYRDGNMEIYLVAPDGSQLINLTKDASADDRGPAWSPWGDRLLYYSNRDGNWDIFEIKLEGTGRRNLTQSTAQEQSPSWQP